MLELEIKPLTQTSRKRITKLPTFFILDRYLRDMIYKNPEISALF